MTVSKENIKSMRQDHKQQRKNKNHVSSLGNTCKSTVYRAKSEQKRTRQTLGINGVYLTKN